MPAMRFSALVLPIAVIFGQACGGGAQTAPAPKPVADPVPHTAGPPCAEVASHVQQMTGSDDPKILDMVRTRCGTDHWSDEARSCFGTMQSEPEADGCAKLLTPEQRAALDKGGKALQPPIVEEAPPAPQPAAVAPAAPAPASHTRGATKKPSPAPAAGKSGNPCDGGE
jgi:hypothetical protein